MDGMCGMLRCLLDAIGLVDRVVRQHLGAHMFSERSWRRNDTCRIIFYLHNLVGLSCYARMLLQRESTLVESHNAVDYSSLKIGRSSDEPDVIITSSSKCVAMAEPIY